MVPFFIFVIVCGFGVVPLPPPQIIAKTRKEELLPCFFYKY